GKAVFTYTMLGTHDEGAVKRADESGAVAIFEADMLPGNMRYQAYPSNTRAPAFTVGGDDGLAVRDLIASLPPGQTARVKASLDVQMVPNLNTSLVWARCPEPRTKRSTSSPIGTAGSRRRATTPAASRRWSAL